MIQHRSYDERIVPIADKGDLLCQTFKLRVHNHYLLADGLLRVSIHRYEGGRWLPAINGRPCPFQPPGEKPRGHATYAEARQAVLDGLRDLSNALTAVTERDLTPETDLDLDGRTAKGSLPPPG